MAGSSDQTFPLFPIFFPLFFQRIKENFSVNPSWVNIYFMRAAWAAPVRWCVPCGGGCGSHRDSMISSRDVAACGSAWASNYDWATNLCVGGWRWLGSLVLAVVPPERAPPPIKTCSSLQAQLARASYLEQGKGEKKEKKPTFGPFPFCIFQPWAIDQKRLWWERYSRHWT